MASDREFTRLPEKSGVSKDCWAKPSKPNQYYCTCPECKERIETTGSYGKKPGQMLHAAVMNHLDMGDCSAHPEGGKVGK